MTYKEYINTLYQSVRVAMVWYQGDKELLSLIPRNIKNKEIISKTHRKLINEYTKSIGQCNFIVYEDGIGSIKFPDNSILLIGPVDIDKIFTKDHIKLCIKCINMWLTMVSHMISTDIIPQSSQSQISFEELESLDNEILNTISANDYMLGPHNQYRYEAGLVDAISNGDVERFKRAIEAPMMGRLGRLADNELQSYKCHANLLNAIASRIAIRVGIPYEISFTLSDKYFLAVDRAHSIDEVWKLRKMVGIAFTKLIGLYKSKNELSENMWVSRAKFELCQFIFNDVDMKKIAQNVGCSYTNLQKAFRKFNKCTMTQYLKEKRLETSLDLLRSTTNSIADIASMLKFANQGHFCKDFKALFGVTPSEYRLHKDGFTI